MEEEESKENQNNKKKKKRTEKARAAASILHLLIPQEEKKQAPPPPKKGFLSRKGHKLPEKKASLPTPGALDLELMREHIKRKLGGAEGTGSRGCRSNEATFGSPGASDLEDYDSGEGEGEVVEHPESIGVAGNIDLGECRNRRDLALQREVGAVLAFGQGNNIEALKLYVIIAKMFHEQIISIMKKQDVGMADQCKLLKIKCKVKAAQIQLDLGNYHEAYQEANEILRDCDSSNQDALRMLKVSKDFLEKSNLNEGENLLIT